MKKSAGRDKRRTTSRGSGRALPRLAYSLAELAGATGIGKTLIYEEIKAGRGPRLTKIGSRSLVMEQEARRWLESRTIGPGGAVATVEASPA